MPARQQHGLNFEGWIKDTFFADYTQTSHTHKWDATGVTFRSQYAAHTSAFNGLPVSLKMCKYGTSIGLGDALRQYENTEDFLIIVGFWKQKGNVKQMVAVEAAKVLAGEWKNLFASQTVPDDDDEEMVVEEEDEGKAKRDEILHRLTRLDGIIKTTPHYKDARKLARQEKKRLGDLAGVTLNPKIDSKTQRRLQCSLGFGTFSSRFAKKKILSYSGCTFWGEAVPTF